MGGVLLAPLLVAVAGLELHEAVAVASSSFLFTGLVGTLAYARRGTIDWSLARWLSLGALVTALWGAFVSTRLSPSAVGLCLGLLTCTAGITGLMRPGAIERSFTPGRALVLGAGVGFGSALTGTGGPVLLLPLLTLLRYPVRGAVGASQVIQVPLALVAGLGFWLFGTLDLSLAVTVGLVQGVGAVAGSQLAHWLPVSVLKRVLTIVLFTTGAYLISRSLLGTSPG